MKFHNRKIKRNRPSAFQLLVDTAPLLNSSAGSAATFSVAVGEAPLLVSLSSEKRQRRYNFSQLHKVAAPLFSKQLTCRCCKLNNKMNRLYSKHFV